MPVYSYYCMHCGEPFDVEHRINEKHLGACILCGQYGELKIVPKVGRVVNNAQTLNNVFVRDKVERDPRAGTGEVIRETIEKTRQELREMREDAKDLEYDPRFDK